MAYEKDLFDREIRLESYIGQLSSCFHEKEEACMRLLNEAVVDTADSSIAFYLSDTRTLIWHPMAKPKQLLLEDSSSGAQLKIKGSIEEVAAAIKRQVDGSLDKCLQGAACTAKEE